MVSGNEAMLFFCGYYGILVPESNTIMEEFITFKINIQTACDPNFCMQPVCNKSN